MVDLSLHEHMQRTIREKKKTKVNKVSGCSCICWWKAMKNQVIDLLSYSMASASESLKFVVKIVWKEKHALNIELNGIFTRYTKEKSISYLLDIDQSAWLIFDLNWK